MSSEVKLTAKFKRSQWASEISQKHDASTFQQHTGKKGIEGVPFAKMNQFMTHNNHETRIIAYKPGIVTDRITVVDGSSSKSRQYRSNADLLSASCGPLSVLEENKANFLRKKKWSANNANNAVCTNEFQFKEKIQTKSKDDSANFSISDLTITNDLTKHIRLSAGCHFIGDNKIDLSCPVMHTTSIILPCLSIGDKLLWGACRCHCADCSELQGYNRISIISRGLPVSFASVPFGWSRYALRIDNNIRKLVANWHVTYHGTTFEAIQMIIRDGFLKVPDNRDVFVREGHIPDQYFIFTSPSIVYSGFGLYSSPFKINGDGRWWQAAIEVLQQPGTYAKERETSGLGYCVFDGNFNNNEVEWKSCVPNSTVVRALLLREVPNISPPSHADAPHGMFFNHKGDLWYQPFNGSPPFLPKDPTFTPSCDCIKCIERTQGIKTDNASPPASTPIHSPAWPSTTNGNSISPSYTLFRSGITKQHL